MVKLNANQDLKHLIRSSAYFIPLKSTEEIKVCSTKLPNNAVPHIPSMFRVLIWDDRPVISSVVCGDRLQDTHHNPYQIEKADIIGRHQTCEGRERYAVRGQVAADRCSTA